MVTVKQWFPLIIILRTIIHRALISYLLIGLGRFMTPIDIEFIRSKVKVTMITFVKKLFPFIFLRTIYHRAFMLHMLVGHREDNTPY